MEVGKVLIVFGVLLAIAGILVTYYEGFPKIPGDIVIKRDGFSFYFPLGFSVVVSIVLSIVMYFLSKK